MRTFKTEGIIIKRKNYSEADRILTVFTRSYGKILVKATGIRRIPSRRGAHVELLNYSFLSLYRGRSMPILTEAQTIENFSDIKDNLQTIGDAYHLCELIDGLCPENQENYQVFDLLKKTLTKLSFYCHSNEIVSSPPLLKGGRGDFAGDPHTTGLIDFPMVQESNSNSLIRDFEIDLLTTLGYHSKTTMLAQDFNARDFIESILERKLRSHHIFAKLQ